MTGRRTLHISHRGGSLEAPENTLFAFRRAVALGTDMLELDLRATADGEVVVCHDATVDRTTDGTGRITALPLAALRDLDAAHWFTPGRGAVRGLAPQAYPLRGVATGAVEPPAGVEPADLRIPTLRELLEALRDVALTMELKTGPPRSAAYHEAVVALLDAFDRHAGVIVGSFHDSVLEPLRVLSPRTPTSATRTEATMFWTEGALPTGRHIVAVQVPPVYDDVEVVTEPFVERVHARGLAVHVWTVDDEADMRRFLALGVDGIMTDRPSVLRTILDAAG